MAWEGGRTDLFQWEEETERAKDGRLSLNSAGEVFFKNWALGGSERRMWIVAEEHFFLILY